MPISRCFMRKAICFALIAAGFTVLMVHFLGALTASPLLGVGMIAVGLSWLLSRDYAIIALTIPALLGLESLAGLTTGITTAGSLGLIWMSALRVIEDYPHV